MRRPPERTLERAAEAPCLLVMLDYDGTLSPIVRQPSEASVLPGTLELLERLASNSGTTVAVISGRAIDDLSLRVQCSSIILFGNHGLECRGLPYQVPVPLNELRDRFSLIQEELLRELAPFEGVMVENKGPTVSVHYRRADPRAVIEIRKVVRRTAQRHRGIRLVSGKKVLELRPDIPIDKGTAVQRLVTEARTQCGIEPFAIYAGDDSTDEDAFAVVKNGATILVGLEERPTNALYQLPAPSDLLAFLNELEISRRFRNH